MPFKRFAINTCMKNRPLCQACSKRPVAVNYKRGSKTYFRTRCDSCIRRKKGIPMPKANWMKHGYRKKLQCEKCGFESKFKEHFFVYHIDGDLNNCSHSNLKTVCANCQISLSKQNLGWVQGDLVPDL